MKSRQWMCAVKLGVLGAMTALLTGGAMAQVEQGRFVGRISDAADAVIVGAAVKLTNTGTNIVQTAVTDG